MSHLKLITINSTTVKAVYTNTSSKIIIICPIHGEFTQLAGSHLSGTGCSKCHTDSFRKSTGDFITLSTQAHKNKYNYSKVEYTSCDASVIIICPIHGEFTQKAKNHYEGKECPKCSPFSRKTTEEFIDGAVRIHGQKYNYTNVNYIKSNIKVDIICPSHGTFKQTPNSHLNGTNCPKCQISKGEAAIEEYLISNNINYTTQHTFDKCKYKRHLPFDFFIHSKNLCIEYDGIQHFKPRVLFGGEEALKQRQKLDNIKNTFYKDNDIRLIRIKYTKFNEIDEILNKVFT